MTGSPTDEHSDWPVETFDNQRLHWLLVAVAVAVFGGTCVASVLGYVASPDHVAVDIGVWLGAIFSWPWVVICLARTGLKGTVLSIGPEGVRDRRISDDWIPWRAIRGTVITTTSAPRWTLVPMVGIRVERTFLNTMPLSLAGSVVRWRARWLGANIVWLSGHGLAGHRIYDVGVAVESGFARARGRPVAFPSSETDSAAGGRSDWVWLAIAVIAVATLFAALVAYRIGMPSTDGSPATPGANVIRVWIGFAALFALLLAVVIWAIRVWDPAATAWEALICVTALFAGAVAAAALAGWLGIDNRALRNAAVFVVAMAAYLLAQRAFRRWRPPVRHDDQDRRQPPPLCHRRPPPPLAGSGALAGNLFRSQFAVRLIAEQ